jgi:hypothetical protein
MSTLNTAQRKALPLSDFGDPTNRLFPIVDQDDVDSAAHLIGKAQDPEKVKARIISIAKRKGLKIPDAWQKGATMSAHFSGAAFRRRVDGEYAVYDDCLLFEAGNYPDKRFAITAAELAQAAAQFRPVGGNIEHTDFLAGKACEVRSVFVDATNPAILRGEVAVPLWLDRELEGHERQLSCEWDRKTKQLTGLALTVNPRIPTAALMAAFAASTRHDTPSGQRTMQTIHDMAAKSGALCDQDNPNGTNRYTSSYFVSSHEREGLQAVHDAAIEHGAKCEDCGAVSNYTAAFEALFAGSRHSAADLVDIQTIHDLAGRQGAVCVNSGGNRAVVKELPRPVISGARSLLSTGGKRQMGALGTFKHWFGVGRDVRELARDAGAEVPDESLFSTVEAEAEEERRSARAEELARFEKERAELARQKEQAEQELARARAERMQIEAAAFADSLILANKLFPAEREACIGAFCLAAQDDALHGTATFGGSTGISRVQTFKSLYNARPAHELTGEKLKALGAAGFAIIPGSADAGAGRETDEQRREKLLEMTPQGRAALARRRKERGA